MGSSIQADGATAAKLKNRKQPAVAQVHDGSKSIRAQTKVKKDKSDGTGSTSIAGDSGRAGMSKNVVKAVLASPLTVAWPNIPGHIQTATLHALKEMIPSTIADYHVSRARCHQAEKRAQRRHQRKVGEHAASEGNVPAGDTNQDQGVGVQGPDGGLEDDEGMIVGEKRKSTTTPGQPAAKKPRTEPTIGTSAPLMHDQPQRVVPVRPEILSHLVLGINEVIKTLEHQIDELKVELMVMGDALKGQQAGISRAKGKTDLGKGVPDLLPTAPRSPSPDGEDGSGDPAATDPAGLDKQKSNVVPLEFIVIPLPSVNPPSLVSPIPQYCATYNALVYQHAQLSRICRTRINAAELDDVIGLHREEVRVVPLGAVEREMAELVGLRRLACLGVRLSHPSVETLRKLLPKSILHSPRHALTLPFPVSSLKVHSTPSSKADSKALPIPDVHYAELHIKGLQTKVPVDNNAKKAKRLEEVRKKRVEGKLKKKLEKVKQGTKGESRRQGK